MAEFGGAASAISRFGNGSDHNAEMQPLGIQNGQEFRASLEETRPQQATTETLDGNSEQGEVSRQSRFYGSDVMRPYREQERPVVRHYENNQGHVSSGDNPRNDRLFNNKNQDFLEMGRNDGLVLSNEAQQGSHEYIDVNGGSATITHSNGSHVINDHRSNTLNIDSLGEHGHVHVNSLNGLAHQTFARGTFMHYLHPDGVTYPATGGPLTVDQYGSQSIKNVTRNALRNPRTTALGAVGSLATGGLLLNNNAALASSIKSMIAIFKGQA